MTHTGTTHTKRLTHIYSGALHTNNSYENRGLVSPLITKRQNRSAGGWHRLRAACLYAPKSCSGHILLKSLRAHAVCRTSIEANNIPPSCAKIGRPRRISAAIARKRRTLLSVNPASRAGLMLRKQNSFIYKHHSNRLLALRIVPFSFVHRDTERRLAQRSLPQAVLFFNTLFTPDEVPGNLWEFRYSI